MAGRVYRWVLGPIAASLLLVGCASSDGYKTQDATPDGYTQPEAMPRVLVLMVLGGLHDTASAKVVSQDSHEIVVSSEVNAFKGSQVAVGVQLEAAVVLDDPLNGRTVRDDSGVVIPSQKVFQDVIPVGYTQPAGSPRVLQLLVVGGVPNTATVKVVSQSRREVIVLVSIEALQGTQTTSATPQQPRVRLRAPLNGRTVRDYSGVKIPAQHD